MAAESGSSLEADLPVFPVAFGDAGDFPLLALVGATGEGAEGESDGVPAFLFGALVPDAAWEAGFGDGGGSCTLLELRGLEFGDDGGALFADALDGLAIGEEGFDCSGVDFPGVGARGGVAIFDEAALLGLLPGALLGLLPGALPDLLVDAAPLGAAGFCDGAAADFPGGSNVGRCGGELLFSTAPALAFFSAARRAGTSAAVGSGPYFRLSVVISCASLPSKEVSRASTVRILVGSYFNKKFSTRSRVDVILDAKRRRQEEIARSESPPHVNVT